MAVANLTAHGVNIQARILLLGSDRLRTEASVYELCGIAQASFLSEST